jgi:hypothetical protein
MFVSGNDHVITQSAFHDVCQTVSDSGAMYAGRDWTYRGVRVTGNAFFNINSVYDSGNNVQVGANP